MEIVLELFQFQTASVLITALFATLVLGGWLWFRETRAITMVTLVGSLLFAVLTLPTILGYAVDEPIPEGDYVVKGLSLEMEDEDEYLYVWLLLPDEERHRLYKLPYDPSKDSDEFRKAREMNETARHGMGLKVTGKPAKKMSTTDEFRFYRLPPPAPPIKDYDPLNR